MADGSLAFLAGLRRANTMSAVEPDGLTSSLAPAHTLTWPPSSWRWPSSGAICPPQPSPGSSSRCSSGSSWPGSSPSPDSPRGVWDRDR